jgi:hypothetical protein
MNSAVIISIVALSILLGINFIEYDVSYVNSSVDGSVHLVRNLPDRGKAANLIAELKRRFKKLVNFLLNKFKKDKINQKKVNRLKKKFNPDNIQESSPHSKYTSFSVNKGEELHFCIRPKDEKIARRIQFHKINTLMFVGIHELADIMSVSYVHNKEFHKNFVFLLKQSIELGIYKKQNYRKQKEKFCGIECNNTPLSDKFFKTK